MSSSQTGTPVGERTVDPSGGDLGQLESALLQEGDGHLHAVVVRTLQQQCEHLQTQDLMGLKGERDK